MPPNAHRMSAPTTGSIPFTRPAQKPDAGDERPSTVDSRLVQETKDQIRTLVQEITALSQSDASLAEFQEGFLTRVVGALAAMGGVFWLNDDDGVLQLGYQIGLSQ